MIVAILLENLVKMPIFDLEARNITFPKLLPTHPTKMTYIVDFSVLIGQFPTNDGLFE